MKHTHTHTHTHTPLPIPLVTGACTRVLSTGGSRALTATVVGSLIAVTLGTNRVAVFDGEPFV
jgi:hypothetical protein